MVNPHSTFMFKQIKTDTGIFSLEKKEITQTRRQQINKSFWWKKPWVTTKNNFKKILKKTLASSVFQHNCKKTLGCPCAKPAQEAARRFRTSKPRCKHFLFEGSSQFEKVPFDTERKQDCGHDLASIVCWRYFVRALTSWQEVL